MKKIILTMLIIGSILLTGCQEVTQQEYDKYKDVSYMINCYEESKTQEELCICLGGFNVFVDNNYIDVVLCAKYDRSGELTLIPDNNVIQEMKI